MEYTDCPCCGEQKLRATKVFNSLSRYRRGEYICSDCGLREAFSGMTEVWASDKVAV